MDLLVSKHSAIQAPQASEEKNFTSLSTAERGKIHTVDTSTPLMAKLDLSSLACAASMICFTVSGSSVCAFRPCPPQPTESAHDGVRGRRPKSSGAKTNGRLGRVRTDLGDAAAAAALRDRGGLRGHESPTAEEGVGVRGAAAIAAVVPAAAVHRAPKALNPRACGGTKDGRGTVARAGGTVWLVWIWIQRGFGEKTRASPF